MRNNLNKRILQFIGILTIIVWAVGFFGYMGNAHTVLVMGLIITGLVMVFIGFITNDDFL